MQKRINLYLQSLRLERWPRSLAFVPGIIAAILLNPHLLKGTDIFLFSLKIVVAFFLTWFISTANYIINEITDAPYDQYHPLKKERPLVKKVISRRKLLYLWVILIALSAAVALILYNQAFLFALLSLLIAGLLYNVPPIRMKDIPILDSTLESANNPIRFLIGWFILTSQFAPLFLLISWWAFGNFLMVGKRVAEKKFLTTEESNSYRLSLKRYSLRSLIIFMVLNSIIFLATFSIFAMQFKFNTSLFAIPFIMIYLIMFMKKSLQDRQGAEEPETLLKNPYFALYTLFLILILSLSYIFR